MPGLNSGGALVVPPGYVDPHNWTAATTGSVAKPWQFLPETYGATGDGKVTADVATTINSGVITSAAGLFAPSDVGKHIMINGANGTTAGPLITTIASYQSATQVTLAATAGVTTTGCAAVWGTDDTAAFNAAFTAARDYAIGADYQAEVLCSNKIYIWSAAPTQQTGPTYNAQVLIPFHDLTGASRKLVIAFTGAGDNGFAQFFQSTTPNVGGTCIVSMQTAPSTVDPTFGVQSVIGGPSGGGAFTGSFANTHAVINGISVYCPIFTNMCAYDLAYLSGCQWGQNSANIFAPPVLGTQPRLTDLPPSVPFQSTIGIGVRFPLVGNNDDVTVTRATIEGYETGFWCADHLAALSIATVYVDLGGLFDLTHSISGNAHVATITNWSCEQYNGALKCNGGGASYAPIDIYLDTETLGGTSDPAYDVNDNGNMHGIIRICDNNARTSRKPVILNGAANLKVINDMMGPGHWAGAPVVPASTVAQQNTAWRDAAVSIQGGTVTVIAVDGVTVATATNTTVFVPAGKNITLTYSVAPTWVWTLM